MPLLKIIVLAIVQGLAELLPVSSSAHVVVAEKLLGLDPSSPPMTLLLVMLHTGTMMAVIAYFWPQWRRDWFSSAAAFRRFAALVIIATACTAVIGEGIVQADREDGVARRAARRDRGPLRTSRIHRPGARGRRCADPRVAGNLRRPPLRGTAVGGQRPERARAGVIGAVQGLCLPFRGFSRSGATISTAMLLGVARVRAESFSFALAVVLTPPAVAREVLRLVHAVHAGGGGGLAAAALGSVVGAVVAFLAGLLALRWLSRWLEGGRWYLFGIYCLVAAAAVLVLHRAGY